MNIYCNSVLFPVCLKHIQGVAILFSIFVCGHKKPPSIGGAYSALNVSPAEVKDSSSKK